MTPNHYLLQLSSGEVVSNYSAPYKDECSLAFLSDLEERDLIEMTALFASRRCKGSDAEKQQYAAELAQRAREFQRIRLGLFCLYPKVTVTDWLDMGAASSLEARSGHAAGRPAINGRD